MSRKSLIRLVVFTLLLTLAVGIVHAQEPVTVTFWQFSTDQAQIDAYTKGIADFEALNPNIKVNMELVPWADQQQRLTTALTTGGLPDVSMLGNNVVAQYQAIGALAPLTDYLKQWSEEVGHDVTQDFWPGDTYYYLIDGDWWGSPLGVETRALWYRKDLLKAAGFDAPPKTWDELRDIAIATTKDDVYGFGAPGGINYNTVQTFMTVYLAYGARMLNTDGTCGFNTPEFKQALTFYDNLYTVDKVSPPDTPTYGSDQLDPMFASGKLAMYINGPWLLSNLRQQSPAPDWLDQVEIAPIPSGPAGQFGFLGGWPLVLWNSSENKDAAWAWIRYATDPEGGLPGISASANLPPGHQSIAEQWLNSYDAPWKTSFKVFLDQLSFSYPYQYPDAEIPQMGSLEVDAIQTAVQSVMLGSSVDDATTALCDRINQALTQ